MRAMAVASGVIAGFISHSKVDARGPKFRSSRASNTFKYTSTCLCVCVYLQEYMCVWVCYICIALTAAATPRGIPTFADARLGRADVQRQNCRAATDEGRPLRASLYSRLICGVSSSGRNGFQPSVPF